VSGPLVSIGLPVYNGESTLEQAIGSILGQTMPDWELLISDNGSTDRTGEIGREAALRDPRIRYHRQDTNVGAPGNFSFLLRGASSEYFCWMGADDVWRPQFLERCLGRLEGNKEYGLAFGNIVNIDGKGEEIRDYPGFSRFSGPSRSANMFRYLADPEIMGKANLVYSVFRTEVCKDAWKRSPLTNRWGSDLCFVAAVLSTSRLSTIDEVLLEKRIAGMGQERQTGVIRHPSIHTYPLEKAPAFIWDMTAACKGTGYYLPAAAITTLRLPFSLVGKLAYYLSR
jgi:glycosyltransferase involved in cell wall biosynthesis